jgi:sulfoxide reductase heme-binding subunit YedZ
MEQVSITTAYMWAIVIMVVFFLLAVIISNLILFKPNNPGTTTRRIWFWVLCIGAGVVGFLINFLIGNGITVPIIQSRYFMHSCIASAVCVVVYILVGFVVSKIFQNSKVGTWF